MELDLSRRKKQNALQLRFGLPSSLRLLALLVVATHVTSVTTNGHNLQNAY